MIGERTNANGSKKFREAMLEGDWDTCVGHGQRTRSRRAPTSSTCASTTSGRDGTADMDEIASRFATQATAPLVLDSTEPAGDGGRRCSGSAAGPSSTRPTWRTARPRAPASTGCSSLAKEYGAAVICLLIDEEGQARDVEWKMRVAHRIHDLAVEPLRPRARRPDLRRR